MNLEKTQQSRQNHPLARSNKSKPRRGLMILLGSILLLVLVVGITIAIFLIPKSEKESKQHVEPKSSRLSALADKVRELNTNTIDARPLRDRGIIIEDKDLFVLEGLEALQELNLDHTAITNEGLKQVGRSKQLLTLSLTETQTTDAGIAELKDLVKLQSLRLDSLPILDSSLAHLKSFPQLMILSLYQTSVTDAGMVHLQSLPTLQFLSLDRTAITDAGLKEFHSMANLRYLSLWQTHVTNAGVEELQKKLPKCRINR